MFSQKNALYSVKYTLAQLPQDFSRDKEPEDYIQQAWVSILESGLDPDSLPSKFFQVTAQRLVFKDFRHEMHSEVKKPKIGNPKSYKGSVSLQAELEAGGSIENYLGGGDIAEEFLATEALEEALDLLGNDKDGLLVLLSAMGYGRDEMSQASGMSYANITTRIYQARGVLAGEDRRSKKKHDNRNAGPED